MLECGAIDIDNPVMFLARDDSASMTQPVDPTVLVARIEAGDPSAEEQLVKLYGRGVWALLGRHTNGGPEAEDLYQETFQLALQKLRRGELRDPVKLPGFLARIARNIAIELYRKAARRKTEADSEAVAEVATAPSSQLTEMLVAESTDLVRRVIRELANDRDRQILYRFYIAEEEKDRISADFGLTSLQFNRVLHRARQRYKVLYCELQGRVASFGVRASLVMLAASVSSIVLFIRWV